MNSVEIFEYWMDHTELYIKKMYGKRFPDLDESEKDLIQKSCLFYKPSNLFIKQEDSCDGVKQVEQVGEGAAKTEKASQEETIAKAFEAIEMVESGNVKYSKKYIDKLKSLGYVNDRIDRGTQVVDTSNKIEFENNLIQSRKTITPDLPEKGTIKEIAIKIFDEANSIDFETLTASGIESPLGVELPRGVSEALKRDLSSYFSESFTNFPTSEEDLESSLDISSTHYEKFGFRFGRLINKYTIVDDKHTVEFLDGSSTTIASLATGIQNFYQDFGDVVIHNTDIMGSDKVKSNTVLGFTGRTGKEVVPPGRVRKTMANPHIGGEGEKKQRGTKTGRKLTNEDGTTEDETILTTILARDVLDSFIKDEIAFVTGDAFRGFHNNVKALPQPKEGSGSHGQSSRGENMYETANNFEDEALKLRFSNDYFGILRGEYNLEENGSTHKFFRKDEENLLKRMAIDSLREDNYNKLGDFVNDKKVNKILLRVPTSERKLRKFDGRDKLQETLDNKEKVDPGSTGIGAKGYFRYLFAEATKDELKDLVERYPEFIPRLPRTGVKTASQKKGRFQDETDVVYLFNKTAIGSSPTGRVDPSPMLKKAQGIYVREFEERKKDLTNDYKSYNRGGGEGGGLLDEEGHNRFLVKMDKFISFQIDKKMKIFGKTPYLYDDHHRRFIADRGDNSPCNTILMRKDAHIVVAHMLQKASHSKGGLDKIKTIIDDDEGKYPRYKVGEKGNAVEVKRTDDEYGFQQQYVDMTSFNLKDDEGEKVEEIWDKDSSEDPIPLLFTEEADESNLEFVQKLSGSLTTALIPIITSVSDKIVEGGSPCFDIFPPLN